MKYQCDAQDLAHYVVGKCYKDNKPVSNLQLQKILYFLQVVYCKSRHGEELLFKDEFEAWPYGPVLPDVYNEFSEYGGRVIEKRFDGSLSNVTPDLKRFIDEGIEVLREKSPWDLVSMSHVKGSPWERIYQSGRRRVIPTSYIIEECRDTHGS